MNLLNNPEKRKWMIVVTIFIAIICNYLDRQLLSILKPTIKAAFDMNDDGYAFIVNIFLICYAVMYPISGILVDRFGPKKVMFLGILAWSAACIGGGLSTNMEQFAFFRGLLGLAEPTIFAGQIVAVTVWFEKRQRATANSLCTAGGSIGTVVAPIVIAWLSTIFPWNDVFVLAGAIGILIAIVWMAVYADPPKEIAGYAVERVADYDTDGTGLPRANVLEYHLAGGHKLMVRPSGTEPKIKVYLSAVGKSEAEADAVNAELAKAAEMLMK